MHRIIGVCLTVILALLGAGSTLAQTPTGAQIDLFRNLPADQQQGILSTLRGGDGDRRDAPLSNPSTMTSLGSNGTAAGTGRLTGSTTILLDAKLTGNSDSTSQSRLARILAGNPYRLDPDGRLLLPGMPSIILSGLTDAQAAQRLNSDPNLAGLTFTVSSLPIAPVGTQALLPFGYDLFNQVPTTFAPATDVPVPPDYRVGPGDNINVELFGKKTGRYELVIDRTGALNLPEMGPLHVTGLSFDQLRLEIEQRVSAQMIGVRTSVTMGALRSIRIFVVGDVVRPGTYTVSGLSTITNALFTSGGVTSIGSLRNIVLKRNGRNVARFDLYDLLLRGDTSADLSLDQGDAIFVPPLGSTAGIGGQVRRPAIYEFRSGTTVESLLELAGGLVPNADPRRATLTRINASHENVVIDVDLTAAGDRQMQLIAGDTLTIPRVMDDVRGVMIDGSVHRPGAYAWRNGMRLTDLLGGLENFTANADKRYLVIRREHMPSRRVEALSADAALAFQQPNSAANLQLQSGDRVMVFTRDADRGVSLTGIMQELQMQTRDKQPMPMVTIEGRVRSPGAYPLEANMTVGDLLRAGGGLDDGAYLGVAELTRYEWTGDASRKTEILTLNLDEEESKATRIQPYDVLIVKEASEWREKETVTVGGEVRFPGTYTIQKGERLSALIRRAGGLSSHAYPRGSIFTRTDIQKQERQQLDTMVDRLQSDLTLLALRDQDRKKDATSETITAGNALLTQLRNTKVTGRLVIDLEGALSQSNDDDLELRDGDTLMIPRERQYVSIVGEVLNPMAHVWKQGRDRDDYLTMSGGTTRQADNKRIYVVRANGSITTADASWFKRNDSIEPGDTIVVPLNADRSSLLPLWASISSIVSNLAITAAALAQIL